MILFSRRIAKARFGPDGTSPPLPTTFYSNGPALTFKNQNSRKERIILFPPLLTGFTGFFSGYLPGRVGSIPS